MYLLRFGCFGQWRDGYGGRRDKESQAAEGLLDNISINATSDLWVIPKKFDSVRRGEGSGGGGCEVMAVAALEETASYAKLTKQLLRTFPSCRLGREEDKRPTIAQMRFR